MLILAYDYYLGLGFLFFNNFFRDSSDSCQKGSKESQPLRIIILTFKNE